MSEKEQYITSEILRDLDALYNQVEELDSLGKRRIGWGILVEEQRMVRRLVEAGVMR